MIFRKKGLNRVILAKKRLKKEAKKGQKRAKKGQKRGIFWGKILEKEGENNGKRPF